MDSKVIQLILDKTRIFLIIAIFVGVGTIIFGGFKMGLVYSYGFLIGLLNFIGLALGTSVVVDGINSRKSGFLQTLLFVGRYIIVAILIVLPIKYYNWNVFVLVLGLLTINISLIIPTISSKYLKRREG